MTDIMMCSFKDGRKAVDTLQVQGQGFLYVCKPCRRLLDNKDKMKRCQYCGVPINADWRRSALDGFDHLLNCPRNLSGEEMIEISV